MLQSSQFFAIEMISDSNDLSYHAVGSELQFYLTLECCSCEFKEMLGGYGRFSYIFFL